jgi:hypothetical protein
MNSHKGRGLYILALVLVILDISTIAVIGSECAKYLNMNKTTKTVKLDDWGVTLDIPIESVVKSAKDKKVTILTTKKVDTLAAPGDSGSNGFLISGTPKTNIKLKYVNIVTVSKPSLWKIAANNDYYFPIKFTVDGDTRSIKLVDDEEYSYEYPSPDTQPILVKDETYDNYYIGIDWKWDFENDEDVALYDSYDTQLGNNAVTNAAEFVITSTLVLEWGTDQTKASSDDNSDNDNSNSTATAISPDTTNQASALLPSERTLLPVLTGDLSDESVESSDSVLSGIVKTGDSFNILLWIFLLVIAAIVITVTIILLLTNNRKAKKRGCYERKD